MNELMAGDTVTKDFGPHAGRTVLQVRIDRHHDGISFTVTHHPGLNRGFTNLDQARTYLGLLRDMARAGEQVWKIEAAAGVLTSTQAVFDDAEQALIDTLNTGFDTRDRQAHAEREALEADVAAIMADAKPYRRVRNTRTHVFAQQLNDRQTAAIRGHRNGVVGLGDGVTRPMLAAIADKGYGQLVMQSGTRYRIDSLTLNAAGLRVAGVEQRSAA